MNFQQLEYAIAVNNHGHFGRAAEACNITQATLSAMIKKLEDELGYQLFDRSRKPIKTTEQGVDFMVIANRILNERNKLFSIKEHSDKLKGKIVLGIIPTIANSLLPIILPVILDENPEVELIIREITTDEIIRQLTTNQIDLGILATPLEDDRLDETVLYYEPMMVYGTSLNTKKQYVSSEDIRDGKIWLLEEGHCFRNQMMTICSIQEAKNEPSNLQFEGNSFETLLNLSNRFGGFTLIPELYYNQMSKEQKSKARSFQKPIPVREISLVSYRPDARTSSIGYLQKRIREIVQPLLSTATLKPSELDVIGI